MTFAKNKTFAALSLSLAITAAAASDNSSQTNRQLRGRAIPRTLKQSTEDSDRDVCEGNSRCPNPCGASPGHDLYMPHCDAANHPDKFLQCEVSTGKCFEKRCADGTVWGDNSPPVGICVHHAGNRGGQKFGDLKSSDTADNSQDSKLLSEPTKEKDGSNHEQVPSSDPNDNEVTMVRADSKSNHNSPNVLAIDGAFESGSPLGAGNIKSQWGAGTISIETDSGSSGNKHLSHHDRDMDYTVLYVPIDKSKVDFGQDYKFAFRYKPSKRCKEPLLNHWMAVRTDVRKDEGSGSCWIDSHLKGLTCKPERTADDNGEPVPTGWSQCESFVNIGYEHDDPGMNYFGVRFHLGYEAGVSMHYDNISLELSTPPRGVKTAASVTNCGTDSVELNNSKNKSKKDCNRKKNSHKNNTGNSQKAKDSEDSETTRKESKPSKKSKEKSEEDCGEMAKKSHRKNSDKPKGSERSSSKRSGSKRSSSKRSGSKRSGSKRSGSKKSGSKKSELKRSGSKRSGSKRSGSSAPGSSDSGSGCK